MRRIRSVVGLALCTVGALLALTVPAGAQQLVDAGGEGNGSGGLAFVLMVVMIVCIGGGPFFMYPAGRQRVPPGDGAPQARGGPPHPPRVAASQRPGAGRGGAVLAGAW